MRIVHLLCLAAITAVAATSTPASAQSSTGGKKTPGYLDEQGIFHGVANATTTSNTTDYGGTIDVTIKITLKSTALASKPISCQASLSAQSASSGPSGYQIITFFETAATTSTTTTCVLKIPYSWILFTPGTGVSNSIAGSYIVSIKDQTGMPLRLTEGPVVVGSIPSQGATTNITINATL